MHIIIDGYNLIRQSSSLRRFEKQSLEEGRRALILHLAEYKKKKGHNITVVFDGWDAGNPNEERDREKSINIIYSRHGEKADDVIKKLADNSPEETVIITSDREIASYASRRGKTVFSSGEFELLMEKAHLESPAGPFTCNKDTVDGPEYRISKKGPAKRLPRAKRYKQAKIKKL